MLLADGIFAIEILIRDVNIVSIIDNLRFAS